MGNNIIQYNHTAFNFFLKNLSIQQQLQEQLLYLLTNSRLFKGFLSTSYPTTTTISRLYYPTSITYRYTVAMQLSNQLSLSPIEIAQQIFYFLKTQSNPDDQECSQLTLTMKLILPGWLDFEVREHTLACWLQSLGEKILFQSNSPKIFGKTDNLFFIEYTYARCCSLLRLGETEGVFIPQQKKLGHLTLPWKTPDPIPLLKNTDQLRLTDRAALALINQLLITVDKSVSNSSQSWYKLGTNLSKSILNFERHCRIFGDLAQNNPKLSQARLGLISISQRVLKWLWYSNLGNFPRSRL
ncbi:DALR anticodon-binding domain-containing protein [Cyanobacterium sp. uoEpiScrs1]|uniref:DALR anticodon-binding domain-containing protein n=1 Tax=Cyanobacterium sp. uoEpiScrs1 TaxID=2976343 RepID=UPI00226A4BCF|nr:DALR anticodon-binding domain-containing protein [Cyanobacterium sp. uoEpiScrs1]